MLEVAIFDAHLDPVCKGSKMEKMEEAFGEILLLASFKGTVSRSEPPILVVDE